MKNIELSEQELNKQQGYMRKIRNYLDERGLASYAYVDTYGCQQNESDSEKIRGMLAEMGYEITSDEFSADVVVINSCAIREHAEDRVLGNVGALIHTKKAKKRQVIVFCGCLAAVPETVAKIQESYKHVRLAFPPNLLWQFPEFLYNALRIPGVISKKSRLFISDTDCALIAEGLPLRRDSQIRAWLPIMYGCNNFCSYCIVPFVRGRERSRRYDAVLSEAEDLIGSGYKDITLLGQNVNSYKDDNSKIAGNFPDLLRELCKIDGDFLLRFMTSHPKDASNGLFDAMADSLKAARHIHLPFQSGSDRILKKMNRGYTSSEYLEKVAYARSLMPDIVITSDVIVGFPGESEQDFNDTLSLVKQADFEAMFTFIYSKRPGTPAAKLEDSVDDDIKQDRFERLVDLQNEISERKHADYTGKTFRVLVDGISPGEEYPLRARTNGGRLTHLKGDPGLVGSFCDAKITHSSNWALFGESK